ncbi:MAG: DUF2284 domain-containing protein [Endomicrobium sp.]|jgi:predicted metal-binding protein|uniref:DUF2284 domain-containing protein n=1 Tax=Candidatus Endomicrobiellum cubanum TaxID=3242325 RepID=UPI0028263B27|nr:DUF2284 domain-containing protein [Endomicrobium sp.]
MLKKFKDIEIIKINTKDIIFEERVKLKCFYCNKYNKKWTCPPKIPALDYQAIIKDDYSNAIILKTTMSITIENFEEVRSNTTNRIHSCLGLLEKFLYDNNDSLAVSFIGGSCKLCRNGCSPQGCVNPTQARIPIEATGINIVKTMKKQNIDIIFPIKNTLSRYGLLLWRTNA